MKKCAIVFLILTSLNVFPHGGMEKGPHGGKIMMPGNFHTELVLGKNEIKIYLLDMKFEKPTVQNSEVKVSIERAGKEEPLACKAEKDAFTCTILDEASKASKIKKVKIAAKREKSRGTAIYDLTTLPTP